jgi:hypothetical protein
VKRSIAEYILAYAASGFLLAMVFHHTLGLPNYSGSLFLMASMACFFVFLRLWQRRARTHPVATEPDIDALSRWIVPLIAIAGLCAAASLLFEIFKR